MKYYLGVDIGASSGRHILGHIEQGKWKLEEVYRFDNRMIRKNQHDCWDIDRLLEEVIQGIKECVKLGKIPYSMSIDTWACDFVLLDASGKRINDCISYRDQGVDGIMEEVWKIVDQSTLYERTGIQFQKFNTLYQLLALKKEHPEILNHAKHFLMVPDYLTYCLTNVMCNEYTNASTTQLVNATTKTWDEELCKLVGLPTDIFHPFTKAKDMIGPLTKEMQEKIGCNLYVIECASHDTASAYASVTEEHQIILSSGTWSLLGTVVDHAILTSQAMEANFTNEGSFDGKYRFLKNIMGLWIIQEVRHCLNDAYRFDELVQLARACEHEPSYIDVFDPCFLHPTNMIHEIQSWCQTHGQPIPQTPGELAACVYHSLAIAYQKVVQELETLTQKRYDTIYIVGGGSQNELLNEWTAKATGKTIIKGEKEATIIGNLNMQRKQEEQGK